MRQPSLIFLILKPCNYITPYLTEFRLEQELTNYSVLHKGDTISITYAGRDYLIDILETKPDD